MNYQQKSHGLPYQRSGRLWGGSAVARCYQDTIQSSCTLASHGVQFATSHSDGPVPELKLKDEGGEGKGEFILVHAMKLYGGGRRTQHILNLGTRWR